MKEIKQVSILYNPRSGKEEGSSIASAISVYLSSKGMRVRSRESSRKYQEEDFKEFITDSDALVVVGGDGTFRSLIPILSLQQIPVVLYPAGNESLVAKMFAVSKSIPELYERLKRNIEEEHYYAYMNELPFFLMASVGLDAEVVKRVEQMRTGQLKNGGSSNLIYVKGFIKALFSYRVSRIEFSSRGIGEGSETEDSNFSILGSFIIGNSSFYARKFLPVSEASSQSSYLFARLFEGTKFNLVCHWFCAGIRNSAIAIQNTYCQYAPEMKVKISEPVAVQIDGDYAGDFSELVIKKSKKKIRFLV